MLTIKKKIMQAVGQYIQYLSCRHFVNNFYLLGFAGQCTENVTSTVYHRKAKEVEKVVETILSVFGVKITGYSTSMQVILISL